MKHSWRCKEHHRLVSFDRFGLKLLHMREIEHILLDKGLFYFLICPVDKELVIEICLLGQTSREKDWVLQIGAVPVGLQKYAELLGSSQGKNRYQNLTTAIQSFVDLLEKLSFSRSLGVSDGRGISCLSNHDVRLELSNPS